MAPRVHLDREQYLKISRPRDLCLLCNKSLNVDGKHASLIQLEGQQGDAVRSDFCATCWTSMAQRAYFSFWLTKRLEVETAAERRLAKSERNEALYRLFAAMHATASPEVSAQLFLLAHLLLRYRVLEYRGRSADGRLRFRHPKLDIEFPVDDVAIDTVDFGAVKQDVEARAVEYAPEDRPVGVVA